MRKRIFGVLCLLVAFAIQSWSADAVYTLTTVKSSSNTDYTKTYDVTVNGVTWAVPGNHNFDGYWRIGGKNLTNVDREFSSQTAMSSAVGSIKIEHEGVNRTDVSVNSVTVIVAADANFTKVIDQVTISPSGVDNSSTFELGSITITPSLGIWPTGSYYKIRFNISNSSTTNGGLNFMKMTFYDGSLPQSTLTISALQPITPEANVMSIYSDAYQTVTPNANFNTTWYNPPVASKEVIVEGESTNEVLHYSNMKSTGTLHWELNTTLNLNAMQYVHFDVYPVANGSLNVALLSDGDELTSTTSAITMTQKKWNSVSLKLSDAFSAATLSAVNQIQFTGNATEFYIDNFYFSSVEPQQEEEIEVESISLDVTSLQMYYKTSYQLTATILPENAKNKSITWSSSNSSNVSVSSTGLVTCEVKTIGSTPVTITARTNNGKTATCSVTSATGTRDITIRLHPEAVADGSMQLYLRDGNNADLLGSSPGAALDLDDEGWYSVSLTNVQPPVNLSRWTYTFADGTTKTYSGGYIAENTCYEMEITARNRLNISKMDCVESYTIRFENWNGAKLQESKFPEGTTPVLRRSNPTRAADANYTYTFAGWTIKGDETNTIYTTLPKATANVTYVAFFSYPVTVTFVDYDGTVLKTETIQAGESATPPADPTYSQGVFVGWDKDFSSVLENMTITAIRDELMDERTYNWSQLTDLAVALPKDTDGVTFSLSQGVSSNVPDFNTLEYGNSLTITSEYYLKKITFDVALDSYMPEITVSEGTVTFSRSKKLLTWEGCTRSVTFTVSSQKADWSGTSDSKGIFDYSSLSIRLTDVNCEDVYEPICRAGDCSEAPYLLVQFFDRDGFTHLKSQTVARGGNAVAPAVPTQDGYTFAYWDKDFQNVQQNLKVKAVYTINSPLAIADYSLPALNGFYDFDAVGKKGAVMQAVEKINYSSSSWKYANWLVRTADISTGFQPVQDITDKYIYNTSASYHETQPHVQYIEDINSDGVMDFSGWRTGNGSFSKFVSFDSQSSDYIEKESFHLPNCDINQDGRNDYLRAERYLCGQWSNGLQTILFYAYRWYVNYQQPDGSYNEIQMNLMSTDEYAGTTDDDEWGGSKGAFSLSNLWSKDANCDDPYLPIGSSPVPVYPTRVMDVDGDGRLDLVDENNGAIWYQRENNKWVYVNSYARTYIRDLNNDQLADFIYVDDNSIYGAISQSDGTYASTLLTELKVDDQIYMYDFNRDGYADILATQSSTNNTVGYAYAILFLNNGDGTFTAQTEQNFGSNRLLFKECQDINGDGYYDLLALELNSQKQTTGVVSVLYGQSSGQFASPVQLFYEADNITDIADRTINVADLDGDGKQEVWLSRPNEGVFGDNVRTYIKRQTDGTANTAPIAPQKPQVVYNNGTLHISWGDGSDVQTAAADLTYALRIGTTSGGNNVVSAHALADGTRRNFLDGNMGYSHSFTLDLSSYAPSTFYIAVQAIDAQHAGSAWSEEATVQHVIVNAGIQLEKTEIRINETVRLYYTALPDEYTHVWTIEDGQAQDAADNTKVLSFTSGGRKHITHVVLLNGSQVASAEAYINVLPNGLGQKISPVSGLSTDTYADVNFDGNLDIVYGQTLILGTDDYQFTSVPAGTWNSELGTYNAVWMDYTHNGAMDYIYTYGGRNYYLAHNGTDGFDGKREDNNTQYYTSDNVAYHAADITHNGYYDFVERSADGSTYHLLTRQADGSYANMPITTSASNYVQRYALYSGSALDIDRDGFVDFGFLHSISNNAPYTQFTVLLNKGDGKFTQKTIPLEQSIAYNSISFVNYYDFNADGYTDILAWRKSDGSLFILYNEQNNRFSAPYVLPLGTLEAYLSDDDYVHLFFEDVNNDGYMDVCSIQKTPNGVDSYGLYVWYMGDNGVKQQGFLMPEINYVAVGNDPAWYRFIRRGGHLDFYNPTDSSYNDIFFGKRYTTAVYPIVGATNTVPSAPTNVRTQLTDEGLLIEWDAATDGDNPTAALRYNLSVKRVGKIGEGAYLISPQNGGNAKAAPLTNYKYITGTQFLIPTSVLEAIRYEISLQTIDLWDATSEFTEPMTVAVQRTPIEAPARICANSEAVITYVGEESSSTPVWDFNGGQIISGNGFGPYRVVWTEGGQKTIRLLLDGVTSTKTITVDQIDYQPQLPTVLFRGQTVTFSFPEGLTPSWAAQVNGIWYDINDYAISQENSRPLGITTSEDNLTIEISETFAVDQIYLRLTLRNANECEKTITQTVQIKTGTSPYITLLTVDENNHNVINFKADSDVFTNIRILKETNVLNQFEEIAVVSSTQQEYTDTQSDATQQPGRYRVQGVFSDGSYAAESNIHKTVHATISRGVQSGTYNLIWNQYEGADVVTYNIYRGASATQLSQITSVAASATSYTDYAPVDAEPYYVVEYVLSTGVQANSPSKLEGARGRVFAPAATNASLTGRSNVVQRDTEPKPDGLENVNGTGNHALPQKIFEDGKIYIILPDGRKYDSTGKLVVDN